MDELRRTGQNRVGVKILAEEIERARREGRRLFRPRGQTTRSKAAITGAGAARAASPPYRTGRGRLHARRPRFPHASVIVINAFGAPDADYHGHATKRGKPAYSVFTTNAARWASRRYAPITANRLYWQTFRARASSHFMRDRAAVVKLYPSSHPDTRHKVRRRHRRAIFCCSRCDTPRRRPRRYDTRYTPTHPP